MYIQRVCTERIGEANKGAISVTNWPLQLSYNNRVHRTVLALVFNCTKVVSVTSDAPMEEIPVFSQLKLPQYRPEHALRVPRG
jgi:hypothetical protein